ncbi:phosphoadenylyl-sulfate reductase [Candidatus Haliotispira prima]|uniref:Adenosine 5'-phosphosulfate reductase n=1 Tax=Candidatus Haliotispira prima TaxID=3034016 RepID=A0ABY8MDW8_9SPIO|nr:phosphoadenylyl-sulfate reductase [Candidatus Haliotispira prima]
MMKVSPLQEWQEQSRGLSTAEFISWAALRWNLLLASSVSAEDQVLWDLMWQNFKVDSALAEPRLFSLDTGRLPQETYDCIEQMEQHYGIRVELMFPLAEDLARLHRQGGPNLFYQGQAQRKLCCKFRKVEPLRRRLEEHRAKHGEQAAWLTGQRRSQSVTRSELDRVEWDEQFGLIKLNPLADWESEDVWNYIRAHKLPYSALHDRGYPSVGCAPCTRAVAAGEDERSGRWWWEEPDQKECGIHIGEDGSVERLSQQKK